MEKKNDKLIFKVFELTKPWALKGVEPVIRALGGEAVKNKKIVIKYKNE